MATVYNEEESSFFLLFLNSLVVAIKRGDAVRVPGRLLRRHWIRADGRLTASIIGRLFFPPLLHFITLVKRERKRSSSDATIGSVPYQFCIQTRIYLFLYLSNSRQMCVRWRNQIESSASHRKKKKKKQTSFRKGEPQQQQIEYNSCWHFGFPLTGT